MFQHFQVVFKVIRITIHCYNKQGSMKEIRHITIQCKINYAHTDKTRKRFMPLLHKATTSYSIYVLRCHNRNSLEVNFPTYSFLTLLFLPMFRCLAQPSDVNYRHYGSISLLRITLPRTSSQWRTLLFREVPSVLNYMDIQLIRTNSLLNGLKLLINRVLTIWYI
jgi:hypothetical protein